MENFGGFKKKSDYLYINSQGKQEKQKPETSSRNPLTHRANQNFKSFPDNALLEGQSKEAMWRL